MDVLVVDHPLAAVRLSVLRDERGDRAAFRAALHELSTMLIYEAARELPCVEVQVPTPLVTTTGALLAESPLLVPVLRAGFGMLAAATSLFPQAQVAFVGVARDEQTHEPHAYLESVPPQLTGRTAIVLDPMIATGGSLLHCLRLLVNRDVAQVMVVSVLAAPEGLARLRASGYPVRVITAAVDERLNDDAYIVPGLGDAGDRQFGAL